MRNRFNWYAFFILFGLSTLLNAQRLHELTPYSFYQKWSLVVNESDNNLLVYKTKTKSSSRVSINSNAVLKFNRRNHIFYSKKIRSIKRKTSSEKNKLSPNWSNAPKNKPLIRGQRCGAGIVRNRPKYGTRELIPQYKRSGIWKVYIEDENKFLVLEHKMSRNGKSITLEKEEFQIVSLKEDKMVLRKVIDHAE